MSTLAWIDDELDRLEAAGLRRRLITRSGPQGGTIAVEADEPPLHPSSLIPHPSHDLLNFGSNDYLGLAADPRLAAAAAEAARREGWARGPVRSSLATRRAIAGWSGGWRSFWALKPRCVFPSGFAANSGTIAALVGRGDVVLADQKNHASLIDGCRLSRAEVQIYPHRDMGRLAELLRDSASFRRRLIVTDTLFSMDGDVAPLADIVALAGRHDAMLLLDEAHATGVFGPSGRGVAEQKSVEAAPLIRMGTLSKALGSAGGFVAGGRSLIEWLLNRARPYVFSTAHPPAVAAAAVAALDIVRDEPQPPCGTLGPRGKAASVTGRARIDRFSRCSRANHPDRHRPAGGHDALGRRVAPPRHVRAGNPPADRARRRIAAENQPELPPHAGNARPAIDGASRSSRPGRTCERDSGTIGESERLASARQPLSSAMLYDQPHFGQVFVPAGIA